MAAVVWPAVYFKFLSPALALEASVFTYVISYFTRPAGALVFGYLGDRAGRRGALVATLILSGGAIFGIALTPGYSSIGVYGAALIILFRLMFGLALGGEFGGAQSWLSEFAGDRRRGLWNSIVMTALPLGIGLAALSFLLTIDSFGPAGFVSYAWRYPFLFGGFAVMAGIIVRYRLQESPMFTRLREERRLAANPVREAFSMNWKKMIPLFLLNAPGLAFALIEGNGPIPIAFGGALHVPSSTVIEAQAIGAFVAVPVVVLGGVAGDRFGRKPVVAASLLLMLVLAVPAFALMKSGGLLSNTVAQIIVACSWGVSTGGVLGALYSEQFPTAHRYTASGVVFNVSSLFGSLAGGILAPAIAVAYGGYVAAYLPLAGITMVLSLAALAALFFVKESSKEGLG
ncbi:MAG: MFS transporter [Nitrososphaerota archaeon]|nr:MFS transporter [Nitrososphaerota archaeon]